MNTNEYRNAYSDLFTPSLKKSTDLIIDKAEGPYLFTMDGDRYLDMVQGIAVNSLGHCHPALVNASIEQIRRMGHVSFNLASYPGALNLAGKLRSLMPSGVDTFFFTNSGAEAVEAALKLARYVTGKGSIIAFRGSFHGRTMGAASVTSSNVAFRKRYAPFMPQVYFAPYPNCYRCIFEQKPETCHLQCLEYLKQDLNLVIPSDEISAILFEPVQGEGGYIVPPAKYVKALGELARNLNTLLIFDEIQTGVGRTGKFLAGEYFGVVPDIICMGKAIGGGFALSVVASRKELMKQWTPGAHGTTFGAHPVACASSLAMLEIVAQREFLSAVVRKGDHFRSGLSQLQNKFASIGDVRGLGLMNAIELVKPDGQPDPDLCNQVIHSMMSKKILLMKCGVAGQAIRFIPPLNIEISLLDQVIQALDESLTGAKV
jgi:4-aminobutyrate aminotransferase